MLFERASFGSELWSEVAAIMENYAQETTSQMNAKQISRTKDGKMEANYGEFLAYMSVEESR